MVEVVLELEAFAKAVLHGVKYPGLGICGVFVRKIGSGKGGELRFQNAIPLLHISKYLTPTMEIALGQVEQHCKNTKSEIVGYYQANQNINDNSPDFVALRIAEKLSEANPNLIVLMMNNDQLDSNLEVAPFTIYQLADGKLKPKEGRIRLEPDHQGALSTVSALIQAKAYRNLVDFDNHLDDLRLDYWTNSEVSESIQRFNS